MNRKSKLLALVAMLIAPATYIATMAQGGPPVGGTPPCWPPPCIPIDGGLGFLLVAGAAFGAKKVMDLKKGSTK